MTNNTAYDDIIDGCKASDTRCQEKLYKDYYRAMMTLCMRYTKNEQDAVEMLNTGFLKVFRFIHRYDPSKGSLYTWLSVIIINTCLEGIRAKAGRGLHSDIAQAEDVEIAPDVLSKLSAAELLTLVRQLPAATQGVFNLYVIDGYSHKEIGSMLGISEGTSKWHLNAARKALQQAIQSHETQTHEQRTR